MTEYDDISPVINNNTPFEIKSGDECSPKIFENFTGSLTRLGHSLLSSSSVRREDDVYLDIEKIPVENNIDIISCSPDNNFVASWCREDGILAVWPITKDRVGKQLSPSFAVKSPFDKTNVDGSKIYISVSEEGKYVSISRIKILDGGEEETPNMEKVESERMNGKSLDFISSSSFVVYSTANSSQPPHDSKLSDLEISGPLIFVPHSRLVCFTRHEMYTFSTKSWKIIHSLRISQLIRSTPGYNHERNQFLLDVYDIMADSLRYGYLLWSERDRGLSVWDLDGMLKQWFYVESKNDSPKDCLHAISKDGNLVASECLPTEDGLVISTMLDRNHSICWGQIHNDDDVELCRFKFEPWRFCGSSEAFIAWLDETRFLMAGRDSVQIYQIKPRGNLLRTELRYIWTVPIAQNSEIKYLSLETMQRQDESNYLCLKVQLMNQHEIGIPLPAKDDDLDCKTVSDACMAVHFLRLQFDEERDFDQLAIKRQLQKLIENAVDKYPSAFSKISTGNGDIIYPMEDFILLSWDNIVKNILDSNQYIPLFHNEEQSESALSLLVELQKSELVEQMISYIIKNVRQRYNPARAKFANSSVESSKTRVQQPGFAWTIGKVLLDLYKYYPDKGARVLKECSYFTTSLETPVRILKTNLGRTSVYEERSFLPELAGVTRKAQLPKETSGAHSRRRKIMDWLRATFSRTPKVGSDEDPQKSRNNKKMTVYSSSSFIDNSRKYPINKESHVYRKQLRKKRLDNLQKTHPAKLCVVPLPDFCVYPSIPKVYDDATYFQRVKRFWNLYVTPSQMSPFADIAINGPPEMFSEVAMEAIIKFKWEKFAKAYFLNSFILYLIYATLFCVTVSIDYDLVPSVSQKIETWKDVLFIIVTIVAIYLLLQEFRQMVGRWKIYFSSFFNYIDLASYGLPLATCLMVVAAKSEPPDWLKSFAVLMVWLNALLLSRAFAGPGKFIAILIEIGKKITPLILTLSIIVIGFSNALFVLLRNTDSNDITLGYSGSITNSSSGDVIGSLTMRQDVRTDTNQWTRFDAALFATYKFLGIGWEAVTTVEPTWALRVMMVLFSFVTVIVILNVLIGLITEVFVGSLQVGRQAWLRQRAELIAELELFFISPSKRLKANWFPHLVYYESHLDSINKWQRKLYQEERGDLDVDFVKGELKTVRDDLQAELKELKGMVGHIRIALGVGKIPSEGDSAGGSKTGSNRNSAISLQ
ncbi:4234_t:CDS:2 [Acaulospora colombiana]|uniref:4234_t:CDS:1 n=1 Tax=Acaulospora colombiana TaxID=27376 RepID=A0ACA9LBJ7_9GLOM|nr:4234_t:CDS:2 [Acaulospora colombiana]